jgi:glycosyltransferase involved in cell wall biosynthesis
MRILMLSDVYFPRINGVSTSIETFRAGLCAEGVATTLVAPRYPVTKSRTAAPAAAADSRTDDPDIIRLPAWRVPFDPEDRLMSWRAARALAPQLARGRYDLIHVQTPFTAHYAGLALGRHLGLPVIASYHTLFEEYLYHYLPALPREWLRGLARRFARRQCNALATVIVPSAAMAARLRDYGVETPIEILPTGIPLPRFQHGDGRRFRARHGIAPEQPVALFVGRVAHEKNIDFLLEAARQALRQCPDLLLLVTGEGPARAALERLAETLGLTANIRFLGYLDRASDLPDAYAGADLFVFASRTETQGLVLLEAMAAGLPVLALAEMGTADILAGEHGCVIGADDVAGFAAQMASLLTDGARRARLAAAARAHAAQWSAPALARRLAALYAQRLGAQRVPIDSSPLPRALDLAAPVQADLREAQPPG